MWNTVFYSYQSPWGGANIQRLVGNCSFYRLFRLLCVAVASLSVLIE